MAEVVLLDTGPLGLVTHPRKNAEAKGWLRQLMVVQARVVLPEVCDYEIRRELLLHQKSAGLLRLNQLKAELEYARITTDVWLLAAEFWADARRHGRPAAPNLTLDADMLLAALAVVMSESGATTVIATTNVRHLAPYAPAQLWHEIR